MSAVYEVEVAYTNRERTPEGGYRTFWSRATVLAEDPTEAEWLGTALVIGNPGREGCMPLASCVLV